MKKDVVLILVKAIKIGSAVNSSLALYTFCYTLPDKAFI
jgi:hypothetical protein